MDQENVAPYIDGTLTGSLDDGYINVVNPSTGRPLLQLPVGCRADAERAVVSSRRAVEDRRWSDAPLSARKAVLTRWAELIAREANTLDTLDAGEMGKPIGEMRFGAAAAAQHGRFYAEAIDKVSGDVLTSDKTSMVAQRRVPRGVVAAIVPWNFPTYAAVMKLAPLLAAGNCGVLKPSELSSRSALLLAHLANEAGLPPGVFNVVPGLGKTVGRALGLHGDVDMLTFTGSTQVGKLMLQYAGQSNMKVVMAECGGKSPHIVFDDGVDLQVVSESIAAALTFNQGQVCSLGSRLLVQRSIESTVRKMIVKRLEQIVMGDALDMKTTFGPVASAKQCERVMRYIETAEAEGAQLVTGGHRVLQDTGGYFIEPTVFTNVSPASRIAQEEIFGPVLSVTPFDTEAEALSFANGTPYGLAAYVWTANLSTGMRMAKGIRSTVFINAVAPRGEGPGHAFSAEPFGQSGLGVEGGLAGMESYLRRQLVWFSHA